MSGFFKVDNDVIDKMEFGNAVEFYIYAMILRYTNGGRAAFPSLELMRSKIGCSNRKISAALKALEERGEIVIQRTPGKNNRYMPAKMAESKKEKEKLKADLRKSKREDMENEGERFLAEYKEREELLDLIYEEIAMIVGTDGERVKKVFEGKNLSLLDLEVYRESIMNSDFLRGFTENLPTVRHFISKYQINKIILGYYRNN